MIKKYEIIENVAGQCEVGYYTPSGYWFMESRWSDRESAYKRLEALILDAATEPRRIVQIAVSAPDAENADSLYALAEDGSLWWKFGLNEPWKRVPQLPTVEEQP